jgi:hypothetical protein
MLDVIGLLKNPTTESVGRLFCEVSIYKALTVCSGDEIKTAQDRNDTEWLEARQSEYDCRRLALTQHIHGDLISKETAKKVDNWAKQNPYVRPVNQLLINQIQNDLQQIQGRVMDAYAWRDRLHDANRFGWDSAANCEDTEYAKMLAEMTSANEQRELLAKNLSLANSGILR